MNTMTVPKFAHHLSRARTVGLPASLTLETWTRTVADFAGLCAYCQGAPARVVEHFIPLSAGGGTAPGNCLPACQGCNAAKGAAHPDDLDSDRIPASRVAELRAYLRARSDGMDTGTLNTKGLITGIRIPPDVLAALDAVVDRENARLAPTGASISRSALIVRLIREGVAKMKSSESDE